MLSLYGAFDLGTRQAPHHFSEEDWLSIRDYGEVHSVGVGQTWALQLHKLTEAVKYIHKDYDSFLDGPTEPPP